MWSDFFSLYWLHIIVAALAAALFSFWGNVFSIERRAMETFSLSQAIVFGSLIAAHLEQSALAWSLVMAVIVISLQKRLRSRETVDESSLQVVLYVVFLTLSLLWIQLSPKLESHLVQNVFGDVVFLSTSKLIFLAIVFFVLATVSVFYRQRILKSVLGAFAGQQVWKALPLFRILIPVFGIEAFGFLFTLGFLFIPGTLIQSPRAFSLRQHLIWSVMLAPFAVLLGFSGSFLIPEMQTTPLVVGILILLCLAVKLIRKI